MEETGTHKNQASVTSVKDIYFNFIVGFNSSNKSNISTIPCISDKPNGVEEPEASFILRAVLVSLILFLAFAGNVLVYRGATRMSNRPFTYNLISNLALAEIVSTVTYPFIFHYTSAPWSWVFGKFMCQLVNPLLVCSTLVITFTLAVIAAYRCLILVQPGKKRPSKSTAYLLILFSWIWGIALALPAAITRKIYEIEVCGPKILLICVEHFQNQSMSNNYSITLFVLQFVIPFLVMVFSYSTVIVKVRKHIQNTKKDAHSTEDEGRKDAMPLSSLGQMDRNASTSTGSDSRREITRIMHLESDLLRMIYIIILVFFLCYLPSHIVFISEQLEWFSFEKWKYNVILHRYTAILHTLPSALHPICYGSMSKVISDKSRRFIKNCRL